MAALGSGHEVIACTTEIASWVASSMIASDTKHGLEHYPHPKSAQSDRKAQQLQMLP
jgi:hypothetical protein